MSIALKTLCNENDNIFRLRLRAGKNGFRNAVTWVYMLEDDSIVPYFHGSELAVTSGIRAASDPGWLADLVKRLSGHGAAGLVINTGKYVSDIPEEVLKICDEREFPLLTMPWEIHMTELIQTFCRRIIEDSQDTAVMDRALTDLIERRGNDEECREILGRHYDTDGKFTVILIHTEHTDAELEKPAGRELVFINRLRRFKTSRGMSGSKFGVITYENDELMVANNVDRSMLPELTKIILEVYSDAARAGVLFMGVGIEVTGIEGVSRSFQRATAAMRMAMYRDVPYVRFEDMGFYKILFSVKDEEVLYTYARDLLSPIEEPGAERQEHIELLRAYIENDRSLERTAEALYLHRNTVNYRIQKLKSLLNSPLKTVEDLFPYEIALAIRDIQTHSRGSQKRSDDLF